MHRLNRPLALCGAVLITMLPAASARGGVLEIRGSTVAFVRQFVDGQAVQSDVAQESIPGTASGPPLHTRARLDRLDQNHIITGGGQALTVFQLPFLRLFGPPTDIGLDLAAFGDDPMTTWVVGGTATETRRLRVDPPELGGGIAVGMPTRLRSSVSMSGVILITSLHPFRDLTGAEVSINMTVVLRQMTLPGATPLVGSIRLHGGANGEIEVIRDGAFLNLSLPVIDLGGAIPSLPLIKAVIFPGLSTPYEYDVTVGEEYELELIFDVEARTLPGGVGVAAVFGLPQASLEGIFARVKNDDRGAALARAISERVDTTGWAYVDGAAGQASGGAPAVCGIFGAEAMGISGVAAFVGFGVASGRRVRRGSRV